MNLRSSGERKAAHQFPISTSISPTWSFGSGMPLMNAASQLPITTGQPSSRTRASASAGCGPTATSPRHTIWSMPSRSSSSSTASSARRLPWMSEMSPRRMVRFDQTVRSTTLSASARSTAFTCTTLSPGCFREQPRDETRDVRRGEAVAGGLDPAAVLPRHAHVDASRAELDRRLRVVEVGLGRLAVVRRDRDQRGVERGVARHRHVVRRCDEHDVPEVRLVDELVERGEEVALRRPEAEVADVHPVVDHPAQARGEDVAPSAQPRPERLDAVQLAVGREAADDPGARRAVPEVVRVRLGVEDDLSVLHQH